MEKPDLETINVSNDEFKDKAPPALEADQTETLKLKNKVK